MKEKRTCRFCGEELKTSFLNLGMQPKCQDDITEDRINHMQLHYPLHVFVCDACKLVQLHDIVSPEDLFSFYSYYSSNSKSWVKHSREYVEMMTHRFDFDEKSLVVEIASNDGYLLQFFKKKNIPILGIEPAENIAKFAMEKKEIPTVNKFFGEKTAIATAEKYGTAALLIGNNVIAHVPNLNDFLRGLKQLLSEAGIITIEFQHLLELIAKNHFDYIMDEHFTYYSFTAINKIFSHHGLVIFDVEKIPTHGGSLRIFAKHSENKKYPVHSAVGEMLQLEKLKRFDDIEHYKCFKSQVEETKRSILSLLIKLKRDGKRIVGYGAPGKGNTLLNYCGIRTDFLDFTVDINPLKHGKFLPGSLIPIYAPEVIEEVKPDYVFILPWNIKDEIMDQLSYIKEWGGKFIIPIPEPTVIN